MPMKIKAMSQVSFDLDFEVATAPAPAYGSQGAGDYSSLRRVKISGAALCFPP